MVRRSLLETAIASSTNGIVIADATEQDLPLIFVNRAFERMSGYSADEAVGRNCRFLQGEEKQQKGLDILRQALNDGEPCNVILHNFRKDGTPFWNELHIAPIRDDKGTLTHFVGVQTDVTRRIEAEEARAKLARELRTRNKKLAELNELKNELLGMAAHDVRNPLTTIKWNADMLLDGLAGPLTDKQAQLTGRIKSTGDYMLHLVNELLDVSKIEAGKLELSTKPCDLVEFLQSRSPEYQQRAEQKNIRVRLNQPGGAPIRVMMDQNRIAQVVDNLISNAIKFSQPDTTVTVCVRTSDEGAEVAVADQGQGIPEEERDQLFKPFARTTVRATAGEKSTGLGLAICKKIVDAHGGRIWVDSEVGKGSTFCFRLPSA